MTAYIVRAFECALLCAYESVIVMEVLVRFFCE